MLHIHRSPSGLWKLADEPEPTAQSGPADEVSEAADRDAVRVYLTEIARTPVLTAKAERALCADIEAAHVALAAAVLALPTSASRIDALAAAERRGATEDGLLQSPEGRQLRPEEITQAMARLARARRL